MTDQTPEQPQPQLSQQERMDVIITNFTWPAVTVLVNGIRAAMPQAPVGYLMLKIAGLMGKCIGMVLSQGDLSSILRVRADCIKAFTEEMRAIKLTPGPMPPLNS